MGCVGRARASQGERTAEALGGGGRPGCGAWSVRTSTTHDQLGAVRSEDESVRVRTFVKAGSSAEPKSAGDAETRTYQYGAGHGTCRGSLGEVRHLSGCAPSRGVAYPGPGRRAWRGRDEGSGDVDELPDAWTSASLGYGIREGRGCTSCAFLRVERRGAKTGVHGAAPSRHE
jgi:hypothetical protein